MTHTCNLSYSGGRDLEDCSLKPVWVNSLKISYLENTQHTQKKGLVELLMW
jgi:hypothetical protein